MLKFIPFAVLIIMLAPLAGATEKPAILINNYIAVFDLDADGVDKSISRTLTKSISQELVKSGKYELIDRGNMDKILGEQKFQYSGCVSGKCVVEAGQLLGVGKIVTGSVSKMGQTYYLSLQLVNVGTGKIEDVSEDKCKCEVDDLIESSKRLVKRILGQKIEEPEISNNFQKPVTMQNSDTVKKDNMVDNSLTKLTRVIHKYTGVCLYTQNGDCVSMIVRSTGYYFTFYDLCKDNYNNFRKVEHDWVLSKPKLEKDGFISSHYRLSWVENSNQLSVRTAGYDRSCGHSGMLIGDSKIALELYGALDNAYNDYPNIFR